MTAMMTLFLCLSYFCCCHYYYLMLLLAFASLLVVVMSVEKKPSSTTELWREGVEGGDTLSTSPIADGAMTACVMKI